MSEPTLLPLVKANLKNIVWFKLDRHYHTHFKDYIVNESVFAVCKALKCVDKHQSKSLRDMAVELQYADSAELVSKSVKKLQIPSLNERGVIALMYFVIELCKLYVKSGRLDRVDVTINELQTQLDKIPPYKSDASDRIIVTTLGWVSLLTFLMDTFYLFMS